VTKYNEKILVVDSEEATRELLGRRLSSLGYSVFLESTAKEALVIVSKEDPDLIILDILLPKIDGYELCRKLRQEYQTPIIIVTSLKEISVRVMALDAGADDFLVKPFSPQELEARIRSLLKRPFIDSQVHPTIKPNTLNFGNISINLTNKRVLKDSTAIKLTTIEFKLLSLLIHNAGKELSRKTILDNIWGYTPERDIDMRIVDVHVFRLRSKLESKPSDPDLILTIRGVGYMFQDYF
jgi:OmpR family response regulator RpaB